MECWGHLKGAVGEQTEMVSGCSRDVGKRCTLVGVGVGVGRQLSDDV